MGGSGAASATGLTGAGLGVNVGTAQSVTVCSGATSSGAASCVGSTTAGSLGAGAASSCERRKRLNQPPDSAGAACGGNSDSVGAAATSGVGSAAGFFLKKLNMVWQLYGLPTAVGRTHIVKRGFTLRYIDGSFYLVTIGYF